MHLVVPHDSLSQSYDKLRARARSLPSPGFASQSQSQLATRGRKSASGSLSTSELFRRLPNSTKHVFSRSCKRHPLCHPRRQKPPFLIHTHDDTLAAMPRRSGGGGRAPTRPTVPARQAPAPTKQQPSRPATTMAGAPPAAGQAAPQAGSQGPGLFGQMASTAA